VRLSASAVGDLLRGLENRHYSIAGSLENRHCSIGDLDKAVGREITVGRLVNVTHIYLTRPMDRERKVNVGRKTILRSPGAVERQRRVPETRSANRSRRASATSSLRSSANR
jgi:hypothetical protein